jgi:Tfp pilus assembly protein FimT
MRKSCPSESPQHATREIRRRGVSLIQMLIAISTLAVISMISVQLISHLLRVERQGIAHLTRLSSLDRLARQFRSDAHAAHECAALKGSDSSAIRLLLSKDRAVIYECQERGIVRIEKDADRVVRRETYRLITASLGCETAADSTGIVTLIVGLPKSGQAGSAKEQISDKQTIRDFRVDARLDVLKAQ